MRIVLDTSVLVAAARSRRGASFALVSSIPHPDFQICLSVSLYSEWRDVLARPQHLPPGKSSEDAFRFLRYLAEQAHLQEIHYLWRPFLPDPDDDMILELAFASGCPYIFTHNLKDYEGSQSLGSMAITPGAFLKFLSSRE